MSRAREKEREKGKEGREEERGRGEEGKKSKYREKGNENLLGQENSQRNLFSHI